MDKIKPEIQFKIQLDCREKSEFEVVFEMLI